MQQPIPMARYAANPLRQQGDKGKKDADEQLAMCAATSTCVLVFFVIALVVSYISSGYQVSAAHPLAPL